jgi:hypothetical protein
MASIEGQFKSSSLTRKDQLWINGKIDLLVLHPAGAEYLSSVLLQHAIHLPSLQRLGDISYIGAITKRNRKIEFAGDFKTLAGNITTRLVYLPDDHQTSHFEGSIQTQSFDLTRLLDTRYQPGMVSFNLDVQADQPINAPLKGYVNGQISQLILAGYEYKNLVVEARFDDQQTSGFMLLAYEHASFELDGKIGFKTPVPFLQASLQVNDLDLTDLNWVKNKPVSNISFILGIDLRGHSLNDLTGHVAIRDASFLFAKEPFRMDSLIITSTLSQLQRHYSIQSDLIQGDLTGQFTPETLSASLKNIACRYLPAFFPDQR